MICTTCRTTIDPNHRGPRLERGAVIDHVTLTRDRNFCGDRCLSAWVLAEVAGPQERHSS